MCAVSHFCCTEEKPLWLPGVSLDTKLLKWKLVGKSKPWKFGSDRRSISKLQVKYGAVKLTPRHINLLVPTVPGQLFSRLSHYILESRQVFRASHCEQLLYLLANLVNWILSSSRSDMILKRISHSDSSYGRLAVFQNPVNELRVFFSVTR